MHLLFSLFLFSLACNLDTLLLAAGYALRGARLSRPGALILASVTTAITSVSLLLGRGASRLLLGGPAGLLGGVVLMGVGLWFILDWLRHLDRQQVQTVYSPAGPLAWVSLSAALGVNNGGAGVAAGLSGVSPLWGGAANFAVTLATLALGQYLGSRARGQAAARYLLPLSGLLLVLLGALSL